jgi:Zn-dependent peptidase ImmA (M78 family)
MVKDHLGNEFEMKTYMCNYWGISLGLLYARLKWGWSLEKALTTPIKTFVDHLGNKFESKREMAKHWNINISTLDSRLSRGWDLEKALTYKSKMEEYACIDHLGNEFESETKMCKHYGIDISTFKRRLKSDWDLEKALTTPIADKSGEKCTDHLGNKFKSKREMCKYYNIPYNTFECRMSRRGMSLEEALTTPIKSTNYKIIDPITGESMYYKEISKKYNVNYETFMQRLTKYSLLTSLGISLMIPSKNLTIDQTKYNLTVTKRIQPGKDVFECYIDNGDGSSTFKIMSYDMIDQYCLEQYKKLHNII